MDLDEHLENEWYLVRYSGEIPEIALHASIYYLTRAAEGPRLTLTTDQFDTLRDAACERFKEIVLRDLDHNNVGAPTYRGITRSMVNYQRFCTFCRRQGLDATMLQLEVAEALERFIRVEKGIVESGKRQTVINCNLDDLVQFYACLGADTDKLVQMRLYTDSLRKTGMRTEHNPEKHRRRGLNSRKSDNSWMEDFSR